VVDQRGLAVVDVGDDSDVADVFATKVGQRNLFRQRNPRSVTRAGGTRIAVY
jgi:hypothetical protein